jgi:MOSC domain-containing protein YiiM
MKLLAISVGQPQSVRWEQQEVLTSIFKTPISGSAKVAKENIEGDRQADPSVHGGLDKAVYAYSHDAYLGWQNELGLSSLPFGSLGENLTFDTLDERNIFVGDVFELGTCLLEAVQPRVPCYKLGIKFGSLKVVQTFLDLQRSGVYFRVQREGQIQAGDSLKLVRSEALKASIAELFEFVRNKGVTSKERAAELATLQSLNEKWRKAFVRISQQEGPK